MVKINLKIYLAFFLFFFDVKTKEENVDYLISEPEDYGDKRMAKNDLDLENDFLEEKEEIPSEREMSVKRIEKLNMQAEELNKLLGTVSISSITSNDLWKRIYEYIKENLDSLVSGGYIGFPFLIRYNFCLYIIMVPGSQVVFPIPSFYKFLIPKKALKVPIVGNALKSLDNFFSFIKKESKREFLISVSIGRSFKKEDLEFLLKIPEFIRTNPMEIVRFLMENEIRTKGYSPITELKEKKVLDISTV